MVFSGATCIHGGLGCRLIPFPYILSYGDDAALYAAISPTPTVHDPLPGQANIGKLAKVAEILPEYQAACYATQASQWQTFVQQGEYFDARRTLGAYDTRLSERYKSVVHCVSHQTTPTSEHIRRPPSVC